MNNILWHNLYPYRNWTLSILFAIQIDLISYILFPILFSNFFPIPFSIPFAIKIRMLVLNIGPVTGQDTLTGPSRSSISSYTDFSELLQENARRFTKMCNNCFSVFDQPPTLLRASLPNFAGDLNTFLIETIPIIYILELKSREYYPWSYRYKSCR